MLVLVQPVQLRKFLLIKEGYFGLLLTPLSFHVLSTPIWVYTYLDELSHFLNMLRVLERRASGA